MSRSKKFKINLKEQSSELGRHSCGKVFKQKQICLCTGRRSSARRYHAPEPTLPSAAELGRLSQHWHCCRAAARPSVAPIRADLQLPSGSEDPRVALTLRKISLSAKQAAKSASMVKRFHRKSLWMCWLWGHLFGTFFSLKIDWSI